MSNPGGLSSARGVCGFTRKEIWNTKEEAQGRVAADKRLRRAYRCFACDGWHTTTMRRKGGRGK